MAGSLEGWWAIPNFRWPAFLKNTFSGTGLGLPAPLGGLMFSSDGTVLYVVGASETTVSALYAVHVTRIQAKLLRAIQEGEVQRLGGTQVRVVDVRLVAASNRDLLAEVRAGRFREDLYYRLHVVPIRLPPLRERREDIPLLVEHFARRESTRLGRSICELPAETLAALQRYDWPGNVRELRNLVERAIVMSPDGGAARHPPAEPDAHAARSGGLIGGVSGMPVRRRPAACRTAC